MGEQELIEFVIQERINKTIVNTIPETKRSKSEHQKIIEAEKIIDELPESEKNSIEYYIKDFVNGIALKEVLLYKKGFTDGVKTIKNLMNL
ncbi:hypothetical protein [Hungatella sp.]|uniref:hypothetical protein n=1 Tax=Hungatella sp. TaxID=2613924 RepID=UPI002A810314|nr:hypothetical protein [Hungatella sp.]